MQFRALRLPSPGLFEDLQGGLVISQAAMGDTELYGRLGVVGAKGEQARKLSNGFVESAERSQAAGEEISRVHVFGVGNQESAKFPLRKSGPAARQGSASRIQHISPICHARADHESRGAPGILMLAGGSFRRQRSVMAMKAASR
jgi:hypothetical protein